MSELNVLLENNKQWSRDTMARDPDFLPTLAKQQEPDFLWIGCSDSRVPANDIVGMLPGELFVHRNVANMVVHTDLNMLSVLQYAVEALKVKHIIVCGHYKCGGVKASLQNQSLGTIDAWLMGIKDLAHMHRDELNAITDEDARVDRLCELNVMRQVRNLARTNIVQSAWERGQSLTVNGLIYGLENGLLKDLDVTLSNNTQVEDVYKY